jgi:integrase
MGLLVECPSCKKRNSPKNRACKCGVALNRHSGRVYWIEWYQNGQRKRERIGPNKDAAEQRLREIKYALCEGRHIKKSPDTHTRFQDLAKWYLNLPDVLAKKSHKRDEQSLNRLLPFFGNRLLKDISPSIVETYQHKRLNEPSGRSPNKLTAPATINLELACLKAIFNKAIKNDKAERNPVQGVKQLKANNERNRVLSQEEYTLLLAQCPGHLKPIVEMAYQTGMRQGEIMGLTWGRVDLKEGFIHLEAEDTKTNEGRDVPLHPTVIATLKNLPRGLPGIKVFTYKGNSVACVKKSFATACKRAGIKDFTFHDLRHTATTNWRLQGHDFFRIMAATGHKTMSTFKRYNTVSKEELKGLAVEWAVAPGMSENCADGHLYGHQGQEDNMGINLSM